MIPPRNRTPATITRLGEPRNVGGVPVVRTPAQIVPLQSRTLSGPEPELDYDPEWQLSPEQMAEYRQWRKDKADQEARALEELERRAYAGEQAAIAELKQHVSHEKLKYESENPEAPRPLDARTRARFDWLKQLWANERNDRIRQRQTELAKIRRLESERGKQLLAAQEAKIRALKHKQEVSDRLRGEAEAEQRLRRGRRHRHLTSRELADEAPWERGDEELLDFLLGGDEEPDSDDEYESDD